MTLRLGFRAAAILIALAALVDPVFTVSRFDRALIAVVEGPSAADSALATRVRTILSRDNVVVPAALGAADALVVIGEALPGAVRWFQRPSFAVLADESGPAVTIERVVAPRASSPDAAVGVDVVVRGRRARGRTLEVSLAVGDATVDRVTSALISDDDVVTVSLSAISAGSGASALRVVARLAGSSVEVAADAPLDFVPRRWNVLFHEGRPSWMSTFVRRAVERDARFAATSRVVTSTNVATDAGSPPARLDDPAVRANFDVIVVGAPDALADHEVAALDEFMRRRGGAVVLLLDARVAAAYDRLAATGDWSVRDAGPELRLSPVSDTPPGGTKAAAPTAGIEAGPAEAVLLRATEIAWPVTLPAGAVVLVGDSAARPVIWSAPVGAGRLTVSGALDSWRFRDPSASEFDVFWTALIAHEAARALPPLGVTMNPAVTRPGEIVEVSVVLRDAALAAAARSFGSTSATVEARLGGSDTAAVVPGAVPIRLLPDGSVGHLSGTFRAPAAAGDYQIVVRSGPIGVSAPLVVRADAAVASGRGRDALDPWISSRGGEVLSERDLSRLGPAIRAAIAPEARAEPWHPMRSPWWIVPFAILMSAEWWLRRRRSLA